MEKSLQELVDAYCDEPAQALRDAIITEAIPLVKSIIGKINCPDTPMAQFEDLESAGIIGLLQALDNYDCSRDIQFSTFAYYRIRGNIVDFLRSIDQLPRTTRTNFGEARQVIRDLQQKLGREPNDHEVASEMDMSVEKYRKLLSDVQVRAALSLDQSLFDNDDTQKVSNYIEDKNIDQPDANLEREGTSQELQSALKALKERDLSLIHI